MYYFSFLGLIPERDTNAAGAAAAEVLYRHMTPGIETMTYSAASYAIGNQFR